MAKEQTNGRRKAYIKTNNDSEMVPLKIDRSELPLDSESVALVRPEDEQKDVIIRCDEKQIGALDRTAAAAAAAEDQIEQLRVSSNHDKRNARPQELPRQNHILNSMSSLENTNNNEEEMSAQEKHLRRRAASSMLRRATRAILLFRRAAPVHQTSADSVDELSLDRCTGTSTGPCRKASKVHQLAASFGSFWGRQTAPPNSAGQQQKTPGDAGASAKANRWHQLSASRSSNSVTFGGDGASLATAAEMRRDNCEHSAVAGICLPRFIVPKMNALKLPIVCLIRSLDGELMREIFVHRYELGQYLIDSLKVSLDIKDAKYFGLKMASSVDEQENVRLPWLDLQESVCKQISKFGTGEQNKQQVNATANIKSMDFYLRIKYYPPNLARVQDPFLRQYLFLQLRRDLRLGKLTSSMNNLTQLMACILQHELGDFQQELVNERLSEMNILPNQDMIERQAIEIWQKRLLGLRKHQVQMQFLRASVILETYGFDYYPVRDHQLKRAFLLGFNYAGVKTIRNGRIVHHFRWHSISKIAYERRMIIFHIYPNETSKRKGTLGFKCLSNDECQNLYMRLLEQKYFFTVDLAYFDSSIRRPSHLTESSVANGGHKNEQQLEWQSWSTEAKQESCDREQQEPTDEMGSKRTELDGNYYFDSTEQEENLTSSLDETNYEHTNENDQFETTQDKRRALLRQRNSAKTSYQSNSLDSAQLDCVEQLENFEQPNTNPIGSSNLSVNYDNCPDCKRAKEQPMHSVAFFKPQKAQPSLQALLVKSSSLQEQAGQEIAQRSFGNCCPSSGKQHALAAAFCPTGSLNLVGFNEPREASLSERTPEMTLKLKRGSLQRQSSTWTSSSTPPPCSEMNSSELCAHEEYSMRQQQQQKPVAEIDVSETMSKRFIRWLEWLFIQPIYTARSLPATISTESRQSSGLLLSQAIRFCLLIVVINLLVHLSDLISSSLLELLAFKVSQGGRQASPTVRPDCIWWRNQEV